MNLSYYPIHTAVLQVTKEREGEREAENEGEREHMNVRHTGRKGACVHRV